MDGRPEGDGQAVDQQPSSRRTGVDPRFLRGQPKPRRRGIPGDQRRGRLGADRGTAEGPLTVGPTTARALRPSTTRGRYPALTLLSVGYRLLCRLLDLGAAQGEQPDDEGNDDPDHRGRAEHRPLLTGVRGAFEEFHL